MENTCGTYFLTTNVLKKINTIYKKSTKKYKEFKETYYDTESFLLLRNSKLLCSRNYNGKDNFFLQIFKRIKGTDKVQYVFKLDEIGIINELNSLLRTVIMKSMNEIKNFFVHTISMPIYRIEFGESLFLELCTWFHNGRRMIYPIILCDLINEKYKLRSIKSFLIDIPNRYEAYTTLLYPERLKFVNPFIKNHFMNHSERVITYSVEENPFRGLKNFDCNKL